MSVKNRVTALLGKHPEGLMITEIAKSIGMHRHSVTKYVYELIGEGKIKQRNIGAAKLCYLKKKGQIRIAPAFLIFIFAFATISLAFAITNQTNIIANRSATPGIGNELFDVSVIGENITTTTTTVTTTETLKITISSITTTYTTLVNQDNESGNKTSNETATRIITEPPRQEPTINRTGNATVSTTTTTTTTVTTSIMTTILTTIVPTTSPATVTTMHKSFAENVELSLVYPEKITRGEEIKITATASVKTADDFVLSVELPEYLEMLSGETSVYCDLKNSESCLLELVIKTSIEARLGKDEIKIAIRRGRI